MSQAWSEERDGGEAVRRFNLEAKKELFHGYQYRLGTEVRIREKDIGRALQLPWKV